MNLQKYTLIFVGLIVVVLSISLLSYANGKISDCESLGGKVVQFIDSEKRSDCADMETVQMVSYAGLALGVAFIVVYLIRGGEKLSLD